MVELLDQIEAMIGQEQAAYATTNYLAPSFQRSLSPLDDASVSSSGDSASTGITEMWREKICEWCYQVIDHFDFSREVVAIAMSYLDRYLATKTVNKKMFQLAAMTALFLAVKLHEPSKLSMASMIELSRGCFTVQQMEAMEVSLVRGLRWNLHPPTAHSFTKRFLHMVPLSAIAVDVLYDVLELSRFLVELSVIDYFFVTQRPSHVAIAAIANAMQDIAAVPPEARSHFTEMIKRNHTVDIQTCPQIIECQNRLRLLCALQGSLANAATAAEEASMREGEIQSSPISVAYNEVVNQNVSPAQIQEDGTITSVLPSQVVCGGMVQG